MGEEGKRDVDHVEVNGDMEVDAHKLIGAIANILGGLFGHLLGIKMAYFKSKYHQFHPNLSNFVKRVIHGMLFLNYHLFLT